MVPRRVRGFGVGRALRLRSRGWVFSCGCVAVAASGPALRKGLDRRRGPGSGRALGARPGASSGASVRGGWAGILPLRVTVHEKGESLPVQAPFRRHDASFARHGPREGRTVRGSRADGESWPGPADPTGLRPTAPVEALSETDPTRTHSNAAARHDSATATQQQDDDPPTATQQRAKTQTRSVSSAGGRSGAGV